MTTNRSNGARRPGGGETTYYVLSENHIGTAVAERLRADSRHVELLSTAADSAELVKQVAASDRRVGGSAPATAETMVIVPTRSDAQNLLAAQHAKTLLEASRVVVMANSPSRLDAFDAAGHEPICATSVLSDAIVEML